MVAARRCRREGRKSAESMGARKWFALAALACAAFILNTSEFMPIGLLTDIAADFGMTESGAGMLITVYAWAVALFSIPLMVFASRFELKALMIAVIALFGVGQAASAAAPSFALLVGARLLVAASHAVFWSIATPVAVRVAGSRFSEKAIGTITTGSAVAMVCGLPLGRAVGLWLDWRMTFLCVGAAALVVLALLAVTLPRLNQGERFRARDLPGLFRVPALRNIYVVTALFATAHFTGYSYIEPFLQQVAGFSENLTTFALMLFGAAGVVGSVVFARTYRATRFWFMRAAVLGVVASLSLLLAASIGQMAVLAVCAVWGACYTAYNVAFQSEVISNSPEPAQAVAMSAYSGIFNVGIGLGTYVGGAVVASVSIADVGLSGAAIGVLAFAVCALGLVRSIKRAELAH